MYIAFNQHNPVLFNRQNWCIQLSFKNFITSIWMLVIQVGTKIMMHIDQISQKLGKIKNSILTYMVGSFLFRFWHSTRINLTPRNFYRKIKIKNLTISTKTSSEFCSDFKIFVKINWFLEAKWAAKYMDSANVN